MAGLSGIVGAFREDLATIDPFQVGYVRVLTAEMEQLVGSLGEIAESEVHHIGYELFGTRFCVEEGCTKLQTWRGID